MASDPNSESLQELEERVERLRAKVEGGSPSYGRELVIMAVWGAAAVFLCWDDVTWWRGELPGSTWGWVKRLSWPFVIYAYVGLVVVAGVHFVSRKDSSAAESELGRALEALEARRKAAR